MKTAGRWIATALLTWTLVVIAGGSAYAHPLGNFSVNRFSGLEVRLDGVLIHYVVDMAEIPTFQELRRVDGDGDVDGAELLAHARRVAPGLLDNVDLEANGRPVDLSLEYAKATLEKGQAGLDVLRIEATFAGSLPSAESRLAYEDRNFRARLGWSEVIAYSAGGQSIASSSVPSRSTSDELRSYPRDLLSSPLDVTSADIEVSPRAHGGSDVNPVGKSSRDLQDPFGTAFLALVERDPTPTLWFVAVVVAMGVGALHALGPGHGKMVMAAYLVGAEGRLRDALIMGIAVSLMHTASVVVLGIITLWASSLFPPESVYPWLSLTAGVVVMTLGAWLLGARLRARRGLGRSGWAKWLGPTPGWASHGHVHAWGGHGSDPGPSDQRHSHPHAAGAPPGTHDHKLPLGTSPISRRGLTAVALGGGLLPSPSALVVLLGAVALDRVLFGTALVAAFSMGLAAALTVVGGLVLRARTVVVGQGGCRAADLLPILAAGAVFVLGMALTARAVLQL